MNDGTSGDAATIIDPPSATPAEPDGWEWALVEIMGFRKHWGRIREVEQFGAKMLRVDVPIKGDPVANGWETHLYGGSSIFGLTPTDEASVMQANKPYESPSRYRLPAPAEEEDIDAGELFDAGGDDDEAVDTGSDR